MSKCKLFRDRSWDRIEGLINGFVEDQKTKFDREIKITHTAILEAPVEYTERDVVHRKGWAVMMVFYEIGEGKP